MEPDRNMSLPAQAFGMANLHSWPTAFAVCFLCVSTASAHLISYDTHEHSPASYDLSVRPPTIVLLRGSQLRADAVLFAQAPRPVVSVGAKSAPAIAAPFQALGPKVKTRWDERFLYVESDGLPAHNMMVGITAWQQQVPLPQPYTGNNAWRIPLQPRLAAQPISARNNLFRGAIALAVNGVPIFNALNNRGEDAFKIGELDEWGGHCGRADDYHYHAAPLHLQETAGKGQPIAIALDGFPLYGLAEPDGTPVTKLDEFNGHFDKSGGYHYHATKTYPYVNGGLRGEVTVRDGQVDPQPRAEPMREAGQPLRGARVTGFVSPKAGSWSLTYQLGTETRRIHYSLNADGSVRFEFVDGRGQTRTETHSPGRRGGEGKGPPRKPQGRQ